MPPGSVEHYEIARYGTLIAWAESLGHDDIIRLLNTNLKEEKAADKKLSTVALRKGVNRKLSLYQLIEPVQCSLVGACIPEGPPRRPGSMRK